VLTVAALTPSLDLTYLLPSLTLGQIHRTSHVVRCAGGKSLNMARAATTMGAATQVVALLGGDTGDMLAAMLRTEGLPVTEVRSSSETRTCVSIASTEPPGLTEVYEEAPAVPAEVWQDYGAALDEALGGSSGWLSISGRAPLGLDDGLGDLVRSGRDHGLRVAVDTHGAALPGAIREAPSVVKVNRLEAAELLGVRDDTPLLSMARAVQARCGAVVVLTDGAAGALAVDGELALGARAPEVTGAYPVGSGDSFLGGLLAALDRGADLADALRLATACGVANALVPGQGHFALESATDIAAEVRIRRL
jgi:1-phosphofructokinase family hexose kinase